MDDNLDKPQDDPQEDTQEFELEELVIPDRSVEPERRKTDKPAPRNGILPGRLGEMILLLMAGGVIFLTGIVVWAIAADRPDEEDVQRDIKALAEELRTSQQANACTGYQNHRAIEEALRDIALLAGIKPSDPRVLPSNETIEACKAVNIEIVNGIPQVSNLSTDDADDVEG